MGPMSHLRSARREAFGNLETHASPGDRLSCRELCRPSTTAHPRPTRPFPSCVPVSEAGTQKSPVQTRQGISGSQSSGHGHGHSRRSHATERNALPGALDARRRARPPVTQLKTPKNHDLERRIWKPARDSERDLKEISETGSACARALSMRPSPRHSGRAPRLTRRPGTPSRREDP